MDNLFLSAALVVLLALLTWRIRSRGSHVEPAAPLDTVQAWPPRATRVLNAPEKQAYDLLRHALPAQMVLAQVPLQRFIKVPTRSSYAEWLRRVGQLSADFVVCDPHSQVLAVVEIEAEHETPGSRTQRRRERMLRVLKSADVAVHVWRAGAFPTVGQTREAILPAVTVPELDDVRGGSSDPTATAPLREPPPSTWFDDFDSTPTPLVSSVPAALPGTATARAR